MIKNKIIMLLLFMVCINLSAFPVIIDINSHPYNAVPNDNKSDVEAIRRAIDDAKDVRILNNMISRINHTPTSGDFENGSIVIDKSEKVTIDYNSWLGVGKGTIKISSEAKNLTTQKNENFETITY